MKRRKYDTPNLKMLLKSMRDVESAMNQYQCAINVEGNVRVLMQLDGHGKGMFKLEIPDRDNLFYSFDSLADGYAFLRHNLKLFSAPYHELLSILDDLPV